MFFSWFYWAFWMSLNYDILFYIFSHLTKCKLEILYIFKSQIVTQVWGQIISCLKEFVVVNRIVSTLLAELIISWVRELTLWIESVIEEWVEYVWIYTIELKWWPNQTWYNSTGDSRLLIHSLRAGCCDSVVSVVVVT